MLCNIVKVVEWSYSENDSRSLEIRNQRSGKIFPLSEIASLLPSLGARLKWPSVGIFVPSQLYIL